MCTDRFESLARITLKSSGIPELCLIFVAHPIGGLNPEQVMERAEAAVEKIINSITGK